MKKILFTVENYYPNLSGVPIVVKYLAEGLTEYYEIHIVTKSFGTLLPYEIHNNVYIHRFNIWNNRLKQARGEIDKYIDFVKNGKFNTIVFECTQCVTTDVLLPYIKELNAVKILHSHGFSGLALRPYRIMGTLRNTLGNTLNYCIWKRYYERVFPNYLSDFKQVLCLSNADNDYKYLLEHNIKASILPNAAEESFFKHGHECTLKKYIPNLSKKYAICVAYYNDVKNQVGIVNEFIKSESSQYMDLVFIGTEKNEYYDKVEALVNSLMMSNLQLHIHLLTGVERSDIPGAVENATLYLCGSKREAYSISLIESMAAGTPFIGTDVGNTSTLPGGIVISDISEMHKAIDELMSNDTKMTQLRTLGMKFAEENCRAKRAVEKLIDIIEGN